MKSVTMCFYGGAAALTKAKVLSAIICVAYLAAALSGGAALFLQALIYLVFPMACIWFGGEIGSYTGILSRGPAITQSTPGCVVRAAGWVMLLLPLILIAIWVFPKHR